MIQPITAQFKNFIDRNCYIIYNKEQETWSFKGFPYKLNGTDKYIVFGEEYREIPRLSILLAILTENNIDYHMQNSDLANLIHLSEDTYKNQE